MRLRPAHLRFPSVLVLAAVIAATQGCTYLRNRAHDAAQMFDLGFTFTKTPQFGLYANCPIVTPVGYSNIDGYFVGVGGGKVGVMEHKQKNAGVLLWGREENSWGSANGKEPVSEEKRRVGIVGIAEGVKKGEANYKPQCVHYLHLGWIGVTANINYSEIGDFFAGWAGLDPSHDDRRAAPATAFAKASPPQPPATPPSPVLAKADAAPPKRQGVPPPTASNPPRPTTSDARAAAKAVSPPEPPRPAEPPSPSELRELPSPTLLAKAEAPPPHKPEPSAPARSDTPRPAAPSSPSVARSDSLPDFRRMLDEIQARSDAPLPAKSEPLPDFRRMLDELQAKSGAAASPPALASPAPPAPKDSESHPPAEPQAHPSVKADTHPSEGAHCRQWAPDPVPSLRRAAFPPRRPEAARQPEPPRQAPRSERPLDLLIP